MTIAEVADVTPYAEDPSARTILTRAMDRYADGDEAAFATVYDLLAPRLFAFFVRRTADRVLAEDLVQQSLLHMHAARNAYARASDVVPWAFAIARNLLVSSRRRGRREVLFATQEEAAAALDARRERSDVPDGALGAAELARRAAKALASMPEPHREAYLLVRRDGLSIAQAASALGATETAVKLRVHRAYEALREALAE